MRRSAFLLALGLALTAPAAFAATEGGGSNLEIWRWANFLLLAGGLGYLIRKNAGPFFAERKKQIRADLAQAEEMRKDAEGRIMEVERRLGNLESEMAALREESALEARSETERMKQQTVEEMAKIRAHAEQEIASAGKAARLELKRYSARLAIHQAEQRVRGRITADTQNELVRGFVRDLDRPAAQ